MTQDEYKQTIHTLKEIVDDLTDDIAAGVPAPGGNLAKMDVLEFDRLGSQLSDLRMPRRTAGLFLRVTVDQPPPFPAEDLPF